jgi:Tfp pilus assembly protein PilO
MMRLLITLLFAVGGIFVLQVHVRPALTEVQNIRAEQVVVMDAISKAREVIRLRDELLGRYNSISSADIDKIRKFLPAGAAVSKFLIDVNTIVSQSEIDVQNISFSEDGIPLLDIAEDMRVLTLTINVAGTYDEFRSFIALLEQNLRLIDITNITLVQSEAAAMEFQLIMQAYYQDRTIL